MSFVYSSHVRCTRKVGVHMRVTVLRHSWQRPLHCSTESAATL